MASSHLHTLHAGPSLPLHVGPSLPHVGALNGRKCVYVSTRGVHAHTYTHTHRQCWEAGVFSTQEHAEGEPGAGHYQAAPRPPLAHPLEARAATGCPKCSCNRFWERGRLGFSPCGLGQTSSSNLRRVHWAHPDRVLQDGWQLWDLTRSSTRTTAACCRALPAPGMREVRGR